MGRGRGRNVSGRGTSVGVVWAVPTPVRREFHILRNKIRGKSMRLLSAVVLASALANGPVRAATELEMFFPVPVQGKLAVEMQHLIERFDQEHPDIHVTAVYTGSYDDTNVKTRAAIQAGRPPAAVIMSANFVREYVINDEAIPLDDLITKDGHTTDQFMGEFWPALKLNATEQGHVYGV